MGRRARLVLTLLCAAWVGTQAAAPAWAEEDEIPTTSPVPTPEPALTDHNFASWIGDVDYAYTDPDSNEVVHEILTDVTVTYRCDGSSCALYARGPDGYTYPSRETGILFGRTWPLAATFDAAGRYTTALPPIGDVCVDSSTYAAAQRVAVTASATSMSITTTSVSQEVHCDASTWYSYWATTRSFDGVFTAGDPCVLDGGECTPAPVVPVVADAPLAPASAAKATPTGRGGSELASGAAAAPSVLTSLPAIQDTSLGLADVCAAVLVTVILSLLVAFPKKLYAAAISAAPARWSGHREWASRRTGRAGRAWHRVVTAPPPRLPARLRRAPRANAAPDAGEPVSHRVGSRPWRRAALGVVAAGVVSSFVDPGFGLNWGSARVAVSLAASFILNVVIGWSVAIWLARRVTPGLAATYQFKPLSLLVVALTVVFTRATGMQPGMVFGLVAGVALGAMASKAAEARVAVVQTGYAFALGLAGWAAYSVLVGALGGTGNLLGRLLIDTLAGLSIAGFAAAPLALLPVAGMGGGTVYAWNRRVWAALYATGLLGFFVVLMPMSYSWKDVGVPLAAWLSLYAAYAGVAVVLYAALVQPWRSRAARDDDEAEGVEGDAGEDTGAPRHTEARSGD